MSEESQFIDRKSLRKVQGRSSDFSDLAETCVCFANATGGEIHVGIEDAVFHPPVGQIIDRGLLDRVRRRVAELTVNVQVLPEIRTDANGGEILVIKVPRSVGVASTAEGRYFLRVGDSCQPVVGDDVMRLATDRPALPWESITALGVRREALDSEALHHWESSLRHSDRVKPSVKEKSTDELLDHYGLARGNGLTNLGVLLLGTAPDRARLGSAPIVQVIQYDELGVKVGKQVWDDHTLSPLGLVEAVWQEVPDFRQVYELPEGLFRTRIPAFDERVIRELLVNALVHRPYTQRGDIFLNLHPDRLEIVNPGRLPLGVTPRNILHESRRRNDGLAKVFHDLGLMEREGSGFDLIYDRLLATGRGVPEVFEGSDSVRIVVPRRILRPGVVHLITESDARHQLSQRERITLGLLAQTEGLTAAELGAKLALAEPAQVRSWSPSRSGTRRPGRPHEGHALLRSSGSVAFRWSRPPDDLVPDRVSPTKCLDPRRPWPIPRVRDLGHSPEDRRGDSAADPTQRAASTRRCQRGGCRGGAPLASLSTRPY